MSAFWGSGDLLAIWDFSPVALFAAVIDRNSKEKALEQALLKLAQNGSCPSRQCPPTRPLR